MAKHWFGGSRGIALISHVGLVAASAATTTDIANGQTPTSRTTWSGVDAYYADYAAMSAHPTGQAMDRWLNRYAPFVFFEDPTLGQSALGRDTIRKVYFEAFNGPMGPVRWTVVRRVESAAWTAVEGWLEGTQNGKPFRTRFSTWLKIHGGSIVHQIDYVDYAAIRRQMAGTEPVPTVNETPADGKSAADSARALRAVDEFYRRYEAMPLLASASGVARYAELLVDNFTLEDPTASLRIDGRERYRVGLTDLLAKGDYTAVHLDIDRRVTDGEWVAVEGTYRGTFKGRPFATRFTTWLLVRGDKIARQIDYLDYPTFRRQTSAK